MQKGFTLKITSVQHRGILTASLLLILAFPGCRKPAPVHDYPISPVPFTQVRINDEFWYKRLKINHEVTIPIAFQKAEETGRIDNFKIAGKLKTGKFSSLYPFDDSDVFKNIEAACYSMELFPDPALDCYLDTLISYIAAAQEPDGYLYTNRTIDPENTHEMAGTGRWTNEEISSHELYNAGHLYEAAVAHFQATGKRTLLDVAVKNADLICREFGWGKIEKAPGHQEIEIGLVKLYRLTGERKYLDQAKFFLDVRGTRGGDDYNQMHQPVLSQKQAKGHAVRAQYMYAAMADIAALTGEKKYQDVIDTLWMDVVKAKTYLTGGIGSVRETEGFGEPYILPNREAYCETCAAIANELWNYRMFLLHGESKYYDIFEKVLYNGFLSGVSLEGDRFFYPNPLESGGEYERKAWFGCACCPVNITRFLPSLPGYIYATHGDKLYINLFIGNEAQVVVNNNKVTVTMTTAYPWDGEIKVRIGTISPVNLNLLVRIPGWAKGEAVPSQLYKFEDSDIKTNEIILNGKQIGYTEENGYASVSRVWSDGDELVIRLPMEPHQVKSADEVAENLGKAALQRGPVIYCLEGTGQKDPDIEKALLDPAQNPVYTYNPVLLNGTGILQANGNINGREIQLQFVPYYSWANRGPAPMKVWIPVQD